jgi:hypothetical protein
MELLRTGLRLAIEMGDSFSAARCELELGFEEMRHCEYAKARSHFESALPALRQVGTPTELGWCLHELSLAIEALGDEGSIGLFEEAYVTAKNSDDYYLRGSCAEGMAYLKIHFQQPDVAQPYWKEAILCYQKLDNPFPEIEAHLKMAKSTLGELNPIRAIEFCDIARALLPEWKTRFATILRSRIESVVAKSYQLLGNTEFAEHHEQLSKEFDIGM